VSGGEDQADEWAGPRPRMNLAMDLHTTRNLFRHDDAWHVEVS
jgi:hypothetical protein